MPDGRRDRGELAPLIVVAIEVGHLRMAMSEKNAGGSQSQRRYHAVRLPGQAKTSAASQVERST